jgi:hypothetical protein
MGRVFTAALHNRIEHVGRKTAASTVCDGTNCIIGVNQQFKSESKIPQKGQVDVTALENLHTLYLQGIAGPV